MNKFFTMLTILFSLTSQAYKDINDVSICRDSNGKKVIEVQVVPDGFFRGLEQLVILEDIEVISRGIPHHNETDEYNTLKAGPILSLNVNDQLSSPICENGAMIEIKPSAYGTSELTINCKTKSFIQPLYRVEADLSCE